MSEKLSVTIAVHGKYQAFRLAEGLARHEILHRLYTVYPKFKIPPYKIPLDCVKPVAPLGAFILLNSRLHLPLSDTFVSEVFDDYVAWTLEKPDGSWVFHGWAGFSEKSLRRAKRLGGVAIVDRACPHIEFQNRIIAEEMSFMLHIPLNIEMNSLHKKMVREYETADYIIVPSSYSRNSFLERGFNPEKVIAVPICNEKMTTMLAGPRPKNKFTVLCVGGFFYRKGVYYLLKAWEQLGLKDAELVFKGTIPKELPELMGIPGVRYIPEHLTNEQLNGLYQEASVFVLPSVDDGFGMVVVEAMRAGVPVIVTKNVGVSEGITDGKEGFVVPIRDINALTEKIRFFYNNPAKTEEMGEAASVKAAFYTPEAYTERAVSMYNMIVGMK